MSCVAIIEKWNGNFECKNRILRIFAFPNVRINATGHWMPDNLMCHVDPRLSCRSSDFWKKSERSLHSVRLSVQFFFFFSYRVEKCNVCVCVWLCYVTRQSTFVCQIFADFIYLFFLFSCTPSSGATAAVVIWAHKLLDSLWHIHPIQSG